ncbi:hypothetical protein ASG60_14405 [Methylobacterium sp. Leaf469]|uniref:hypothetical protein n=1 Tax=Methylobacterium sp. Leaf469 TaxID=1736387 RepID=UPI0006F9A1F4|nr:hypothetical protein [Methylobacterium sp. Leaf469]KQT86658.1 hypothetical protein ASG60_14405 [Methylobacterium sp. Leaf469]
MAVPMTSLSRAPNGDWFARKGIPKDIRDAYRKAFGVSQEERFRRPGSLSTGSAKVELRDWDATVTGRIEALRAAARGEGVGLTHREAHALVGRWYAWFVAGREQEPGQPGEWDYLAGQLQDAREAFTTQIGAPGEEEEHETSATRRRVRAVVAELGRVPTFLGEQGLNLTQEASDALLDLLDPELLAAIHALRRRADGDYTADARPLRHPEARQAQAPKQSGLSCWSLFEAWVTERRPGASTVNRWRAVFRGLEEHFEGRDIGAISADDAVAWKNTLVTDVTGWLWTGLIERISQDRRSWTCGEVRRRVRSRWC